jgi:hypothetical protein
MFAHPLGSHLWRYANRTALRDVRASIRLPSLALCEPNRTATCPRLVGAEVVMRHLRRDDTIGFEERLFNLFAERANFFAAADMNRIKRNSFSG